MRVALINNLYKPYNKGGAERITELYFDYFNKNIETERLIVITSGLNKTEYKTINQKSAIYYIKNFNFFSYININKYNIFWRAIWRLWDLIDFFTAYKIYKILKTEKINYVFVHNLTGLSYLTAYFLKSFKRKVLILHDVQLLYPSGLISSVKRKNLLLYLYQFWTALLFKKFNLIISPSKFLKDFYQKHIFWAKRNIQVLRNPVDEKDYKMIEHDFDKNNIKILFVGHLNEAKGLFTVIEEILKHKNFSLHVVGKGPLEKDLDKYLKNFNNLYYYSSLSHEALLNLYDKMNFLLVPSQIYENLPTTILEASARSLPIIARDIGGIHDFVELGLIDFVFQNKEDFIQILVDLQSLHLDKYRNLEKRTYQIADEWRLNVYFEKLLKKITGLS